ncbi:hypothetical protein AX774_g2717 [Zancudomyces culisetae]|uniref:BRCT domain-containing protein n=1 Tax=Zancudomyces culisetae TaxID=1213189 RepID=A0A1R1PS47_ZANCU|nr:hypothetical protein AX774_g2717 [Zancudomyces culisetae]|eukprot:OMH83771.1 hypothetical protein AX774_g2717 [Zancudomyces culisetae]
MDSTKSTESNEESDEECEIGATQLPSAKKRVIKFNERVQEYEQYSEQEYLTENESPQASIPSSLTVKDEEYISSNPFRHTKIVKAQAVQEVDDDRWVLEEDGVSDESEIEPTQFPVNNRRNSTGRLEISETNTQSHSDMCGTWIASEKEYSSIEQTILYTEDTPRKEEDQGREEEMEEIEARDELMESIDKSYLNDENSDIGPTQYPVVGKCIESNSVEVNCGEPTTDGDNSRAQLDAQSLGPLKKVLNSAMSTDSHWSDNNSMIETPSMFKGGKRCTDANLMESGGGGIDMQSVELNSFLVEYGSVPSKKNNVQPESIRDEGAYGDSYKDDDESKPEPEPEPDSSTQQAEKPKLFLDKIKIDTKIEKNMEPTEKAARKKRRLYRSSLIMSGGSTQELPCFDNLVMKTPQSDKLASKKIAKKIEFTTIKLGTSKNTDNHDKNDSESGGKKRKRVKIGNICDIEIKKDVCSAKKKAKGILGYLTDKMTFRFSNKIKEQCQNEPISVENSPVKDDIEQISFSDVLITPDKENTLPKNRASQQQVEELAVKGGWVWMSLPGNKHTYIPAVLMPSPENNQLTAVGFSADKSRRIKPLVFNVDSLSPSNVKPMARGDRVLATRKRKRLVEYATVNMLPDKKETEMIRRTLVNESHQLTNVSIGLLFDGGEQENIFVHKLCSNRNLLCIPESIKKKKHNIVKSVPFNTNFDLSLFEGYSFLITTSPSFTISEYLSDLYNYYLQSQEQNTQQPMNMGSYDSLPVFPKNSSVKFDKKVLIDSILQRSGSIVDDPFELDPTNGVAVVVADTPSATPKYLVGLAHGLPIVSLIWVLKSVINNCIQPIDQYRLSNGWSDELNSAVGSFHNSQFFAGYSVMVIGSSSTFTKNWTFVFNLIGATVVTYCDKLPNATDNTLDFVLSESKPDSVFCSFITQNFRSILHSSATPLFVSSVWARQCLINQRVLTDFLPSYSVYSRVATKSMNALKLV